MRPKDWYGRCEMRSACRFTSTRMTQAESMPSSLLKASDAGVDVVDGAIASMSGTTSQPNLNSMVAALQHTDRATGLDMEALNQLEDYWGDVRDVLRTVRQRTEVGQRRSLPA